MKTPKDKAPPEALPPDNARPWWAEPEQNTAPEVEPIPKAEPEEVEPIQSFDPPPSPPPAVPRRRSRVEPDTLWHWIQAEARAAGDAREVYLLWQAFEACDFGLRRTALKLGMDPGQLSRLLSERYPELRQRVRAAQQQRAKGPRRPDSGKSTSQDVPGLHTRPRNGDKPT